MNNLKDKKFALVFGQSIEGCGVTRTGSEMEYWCKKNGVNLTVYSYDERTYNRRDAHVLNFKPFMREDIDKIVNELNTYDAVIFNSYPSAKFPKESIKDFYEKLIKNITTIKVGFMHELNKTNIDKIPYLVAILNQMDLIYNFAETTWFSKTISNMLPSKTIGERVKKFTMWFNFDILDDYRNSIKLEEKEKKLLYIGRWTTMKDPRRVLELGPMLLKEDPEFKCELIGIERSIGAKCDIFDHPNVVDRTGKEEKKGPNGCVPVYGTYVRKEGMDTLAHTLFGCSFYRMPKEPQNYGDRMEYTQMEIIGVGSIPVFDSHWGKNNFRRNGMSYYDTPYSAIYSDKDNLPETVNKLIEVANNKELQEKYREASYEIAKQEFDADIVLPELFNHIINVGIDKNKFKTDDELILALTKSNEFLNDLKEQQKLGEIPIFGIRELTNRILSILDGKKEKEIKKYK